MPEKLQRSSDLSSSRSYPCHAATRIGRVASRVSSAALSTAKTSLLRRDRVGDDHHAARLAVCEDCPGGHAVKGKDGSLRTCGPMLASLTVEGKSTCGCVLNQKARDLKQACPFGYWESVDRRAAWESMKPRAVVAGLGDLLLSRRSLLGGAAAAAAALLLPAKAWAADDSPCLIPIAGCDGGAAKLVPCHLVAKRKLGSAFRNAGDGKCYSISGLKPVARLIGDRLATSADGEYDGCANCPPNPEGLPPDGQCPNDGVTRYIVSGGPVTSVGIFGGGTYNYDTFEFEGQSDCGLTGTVENNDYGSWDMILSPVSNCRKVSHGNNGLASWSDGSTNWSMVNNGSLNQQPNGTIPVDALTIAAVEYFPGEQIYRLGVAMETLENGGSGNVAIFEKNFGEDSSGTYVAVCESTSPGFLSLTPAP